MNNRCPESYEGKRCEKEVAHPSILKGEGAMRFYHMLSTGGQMLSIALAWHDSHNEQKLFKRSEIASVCSSPLITFGCCYLCLSIGMPGC